MRILIFGAKGWIGQQFQAVCARAARTTSTGIEYKASEIRRMSLDTQSELITEITNYKPTHVISFVGRTHGTIGDRVFSTIDYLEQDDKLGENMRDNLFAPLTLADVCANMPGYTTRIWERGASSLTGMAMTRIAHCIMTMLQNRVRSRSATSLKKAMRRTFSGPAIP